MGRSLEALLELADSIGQREPECAQRLRDFAQRMRTLM
jgi:hypothetical protein